MAERRPSIVMIVAHDLGTHLGCYEAGLETPQIDALAADGVRFDQYHCTAAQCSPARGSMITGRYPHNNGLIGLTHGGWALRPEIPTLMQSLRASGYSTHLFGVQHETDRSEEAVQALGYEAIEAGGAHAQTLAGQFAQWAAARDDEAPFFASIGTAETHRPFNREGYPNDDPAQVTPLPWLPDRPGMRTDIAGLNGLTYAFDEAVGMVRAGLEDSGLAENTLLIVTCDHGIAMPRAKCTCYDPGTRVTLIMRLPGRFDGGRAHEELLSATDLMPTLLELAGAPEVEDMDGRSFLGLLDGGGYVPREHIFTEMTYHGMYNPMRAIRTRTHKYIRNFGELPLVYMPVDIWEGPAGQEMSDEYYGSARPREELYDLQADPWEQRNLVDEPGHEKLLCDLANPVDAWMEESGDLLLQGRWPATPRHIETTRERFDEPRFAPWMQMTRRDWPEMLWFVEER